MDFSEHRFRLQLHTDWKVNKNTNVLRGKKMVIIETLPLSSKHLGKSKRSKNIIPTCIKVKSK